MRRVLTRAIRDDAGQDLIEYAILAAFISLIATTFILNIGQRVNEWYEGYSSTIATIPSGS